MILTVRRRCLVDSYIFREGIVIVAFKKAVFFLGSDFSTLVS